MKGRVIGYDSTTYKGAINGQDGQRYDFVMQDWRGTATPRVNGEVDFLSEGSHAREIYSTVAPAAPSMSFGNAIGRCFRKYASFGGRARRKEYWYFVLFGTIVDVVAMIFDNAMGNDFTTTLPSGEPFSMVYGPIYALAALVLFLPSISALVRRLHDRDKSGWWFWISLTIIGAIPLLVWLCQKGTTGENRFGPDSLSAA